MTFGEHGIRWRILAFDVEKLVERAKRSQPAVDRGDGVTKLVAVVNVAVNVAEGDRIGRLVRPGEEELEVAGVVYASCGMQELAPQPLVELRDFG